MPGKRNKIILLLIIGLGFLLAMFVFSILTNERYLWNVKHGGGMTYIDISEAPTDEPQKKGLLFVVPDGFKPVVHKTGFVFSLKFTDGSPYTGNEMPKPDDQVRVGVLHVKEPHRRKSEYTLKRTQPQNGTLKNVPSLVKSINGLEIYQYDYGKNETTIGKIYSFFTEEGDRVVVEDPGDWAWGYKVARRLTDNIELEYQFSKKQVHVQKSFVSDVMRVDNAVVKAVKSFQSK